MPVQSKIENIKSIITDESVSLNLYFITRHVKDGVAKSKRSVDKFTFKTNSIDISTDLVKFFVDITKKQLEKITKKKGYELENYTVISDDLSDKLYTYALNNALSFSDVITKQIPSGDVSAVSSLKDLNNDIWAYCLKIEAKGNSAYIFRKLSASKVSTDEPRTSREKFASYFDSSSSELKIVSHETISFDDKLDCIFTNDEFLIFRKSSFESIVGLEEEFTENAKKVIATLKEADIVEGIELIEEEIAKSKPLLKSLSSISRKGNDANFNENELSKMKNVYKQFENKELKCNSAGKLLIENKGDVKIFVKLLNDYYKQGMITGKYYGTNSGNVIKISS